MQQQYIGVLSSGTGHKSSTITVATKETRSNIQRQILLTMQALFINAVGLI
jgi:hypothetical protein